MNDKILEFLRYYYPIDDLRIYIAHYVTKDSMVELFQKIESKNQHVRLVLAHPSIWNHFNRLVFGVSEKDKTLKSLWGAIVVLDDRLPPEKIFLSPFYNLENLDETDLKKFAVLELC